MKEVEGCYPYTPKVAVTGLSFGHSEEFFGDSGILLRRLRRCAETPHMSGLRTLHRNPCPETPEKSPETSNFSAGTL
jgi:hypothetical protein